MRRFHSLSCFVVLILTATATIRAQTGDQAYFQDATVIGGTNSISITRVPVTAGGVSYYWDITLPFTVDAEGNVSVGTLTQVKSPALIVSAFKPGTYVGPPTILSGTAKVVLSGPGIFNGKYTEWTITTAQGANGCTYPESGAFYVVPQNSLTNNPLYPRLKAASITSGAYSYGTGTSGCGYNAWPGNGIIGVSQVGNTLSFSSFSQYGLPDSDIPYDQITYTLVQ